MAVQKFGKKLLVDGNFTAVQRCEFLLVVVDQDHVMTKVREAGARDQSDVSRTYDGDTHWEIP
jgi:hypothetical protein